MTTTEITLRSVEDRSSQIEQCSFSTKLRSLFSSLHTKHEAKIAALFLSGMSALPTRAQEVPPPKGNATQQAYSPRERTRHEGSLQVTDVIHSIVVVGDEKEGKLRITFRDSRRLKPVDDINENGLSSENRDKARYQSELIHDPLGIPIESTRNSLETIKVLERLGIKVDQKTLDNLPKNLPAWIATDLNVIRERAFADQTVEVVTFSVDFLNSCQEVREWGADEIRSKRKNDASTSIEVFPPELSDGVVSLVKPGFNSSLSVVMGFGFIEDRDNEDPDTYRIVFHIPKSDFIEFLESTNNGTGYFRHVDNVPAYRVQRIRGSITGIEELTSKLNDEIRSIKPLKYNGEEYLTQFQVDELVNRVRAYVEAHFEVIGGTGSQRWLVPNQILETLALNSTFHFLDKSTVTAIEADLIRENPEQESNIKAWAGPNKQRSTESATDTSVKQNETTTEHATLNEQSHTTTETSKKSGGIPFITKKTKETQTADTNSSSELNGQKVEDRSAQGSSRSSDKEITSNSPHEITLYKVQTHGSGVSLSLNTEYTIAIEEEADALVTTTPFSFSDKSLQKNLDARRDLGELSNDIEYINSELTVLYNYLLCLTRGEQELDLPKLFDQDENALEDCNNVNKVKERLNDPKIRSVYTLHKRQYLADVLEQAYQDKERLEEQIKEIEENPLPDRDWSADEPVRGFIATEEYKEADKAPPTPTEVYEAYRSENRYTSITNGAFEIVRDLIELPEDEKPLPKVESWAEAADSVLRHVRLNPRNISQDTAFIIAELFNDGIAMKDLHTGVKNEAVLNALLEIHAKALDELLADKAFKELIMNYIEAYKNLDSGFAKNTLTKGAMEANRTGHEAIMNYKSGTEDKYFDSGIAIFRMAVLSGVNIPVDYHGMLYLWRGYATRAAEDVAEKINGDTNPERFTRETMGSWFEQFAREGIKKDMAEIETQLRLATGSQDPWPYQNFLDGLEALIDMYNYSN